MEQVKLTRRSFVAGATAAGALAALSLTGCGGGSSSDVASAESPSRRSASLRFIFLSAPKDQRLQTVTATARP